MPKIIRLTLFKVSDPDTLEATIKKYSTLSKDAEKDGAPYISLAQATKTYDDPRNQGFTICARTIFNSKEDMDYYDSECKAHVAIKETLKGKVQQPGGVLMIYMDAEGGPAGA